MCALLATYLGRLAPGIIPLPRKVQGIRNDYQPVTPPFSNPVQEHF